MSARPQMYNPYSSSPMGYPSMGGYPQQMGGPAGGQFYNTVRSDNGKVVDQYMVPGEARQISENHQVQGMQTVMDTQTVYDPREVQIQVPKTVMEDVEITYQVPAMDTRTHTLQRPKTVMEEKMVTVQEQRTVMETRQVQTPQYVMAQQTQIRQKVVEYERPKMIPGAYVRTYDAGQATYSQPQQTAVSQPMRTYEQPMMQSYSQPMMQSYSQPVHSYQQPYGTSQQPMIYNQPSYSNQSPYVPQQLPDDAISA